MPALVKTDYIGKIIWLGHVADRAAALRSKPLSSVNASFKGLDGEDHGGLTRASCARVTMQYPRNTEIRNTRQICIVSAEELMQIAARMGLDQFDPEWCGASMVIEGIPDLSHIPPSTRLQINNVATLTVDMENRPCNLPAKVIEEDAPGFGKAFKSAAKDLRGVTAWVEREGEIALGDDVTVHIPDQPVWRPLRT